MAVDVRNAVIGLQQAHVRYETAVETRELAAGNAGRRSSKKYELRQTPPTPLVIQAQRDVVNAESEEVQSMANYTHARIAFEQALGVTLERNGITMAEAIVRPDGTKIRAARRTAGKEIGGCHAIHHRRSLFPYLPRRRPASLPPQAPLPIAPVKPRGMPFVRSYKGVERSAATPLQLDPTAQPGPAGNLYLRSMTPSSSRHRTISISKSNAITDEADGTFSAPDPADRCAESPAPAPPASAWVPARGGWELGRRRRHRVVAARRPLRRRARPANRSRHAAARSRRHHQHEPATSPRRRPSWWRPACTSWWMPPALINSDSQGLLTGGRVRMSYNGSYLDEAVPTDLLNPTSYVSLGVSVSQHLLSGFGERVNGRFIRIAQRRAADSSLAFQIGLAGMVASMLDASIGTSRSPPTI